MIEQYLEFLVSKKLCTSAAAADKGMRAQARRILRAKGHKVGENLRDLAAEYLKAHQQAIDAAGAS